MYEQVARRLLTIEEHKYGLTSDTESYKAACRNKFGDPEIEATLRNVVRRLRLLKGIRAAIGRKGFSAELKVLPTYSSADFLELTEAFQTIFHAYRQMSSNLRHVTIRKRAS